MSSLPYFKFRLIFAQTYFILPGLEALIYIIPYETLANVNDVSAKEYKERSYKDTSLHMLDSPRPLQPHLYDLAARVYLLMRRRNESQAVVTWFVT